jgi:hypothetical protein
MSNELINRQEAALQAMMNVEYLPAAPNLDLSMRNADRIPLEKLTALGVAFQPLTTAIQTIVNGAGGSGIYYVNTKGMQMFSAAEGYIGSLKTAAGTVGGGQARMTVLPCDPTMLAMAAVLMSVEKKLDAIQETQEEILEFLVEKERATLQGNLNILGEVMSDFKYNWTNDTYKHSKIVLIQQIKKEAADSIVLYRGQIAKKLKKRTAFHSDKSVKEILKDLQSQFTDYQLALYLYSYSSFLEVMLEGNFGEGYLNSIEQRILEYSLQYRTLYTESYDLMEDYSKSSVQASVLNGLATVSKFMGEAIAKVPVISKSQLDENLIETGDKLDKQGSKRASDALGGLAQTRMSVTLPFVENIRTINDLYNKPVTYLFDGQNMYVQQITG